MKPVLTKVDFVRRYAAHEFGNHSPTWSTIDWYNRASSYPSDWKYHLRNKTAGGETHYNLSRAILFNKIAQLMDKGELDKWYVSAMAPHEHNLLQGEVQRGPWGLYLHYSTVKGLPMRDALAVEAKDAQGLEAKLLLDWALNDLSRQWLDYLLETYDGHVVEFSSFGVCFGPVENHNTVIWEVRMY